MFDMPDLYSSKTVLNALKKSGFEKVSQKGSHIKLRRTSEEKVLTVIVPDHKMIAKGTFSSILRQAKMSKAEFESNL